MARASDSSVVRFRTVALTKLGLNELPGDGNLEVGLSSLLYLEEPHSSTCKAQMQCLGWGLWLDCGISEYTLVFLCARLRFRKMTTAGLLTEQGEGRSEVALLP